jgi:hypothetical protein
MAKKSMRNLAKVAAGLGAAYALSKMGKGTMDGTEGDFPASSVDNTSMDGTEGTFPESKKDFNEPGFKKIQRNAAQRFAEREAFNKKVKEINEARTGMKNPRYKKGGSVHVKTKLGYSKATKIY